MATLNIKNFSTLVQNQAAAIQGRARELVDFTVGSILRSLIESNAAVALWLQSLAVKILAVTRAATSTGEDLDSFVNDYGLVRLGAQNAIGTVTFSRFTPGAQAVIPLGARVATTDGATQFEVVLDPSHGSYNAGLGGYVVPVGIPSIDVPVRALQPGQSGNIVAGFVTLIQTSIPYIDTVTNVAPLSGGSDAESDAALRERFVAFINSLSKATSGAIGFAITSLRLGLQYTIRENYNYDGSWRPGYFSVVVDDGSGNPPDSLISEVYAAIDRVRGATIMFGVFRPTVVLAHVSMNVTVKAGYDANVVKAQVGTAIRTWIDDLYLGTSLPWSKLMQLAYEASPGVENVYALQLNGQAADLNVTFAETVKAGVIAVS